MAILLISHQNLISVYSHQRFAYMTGNFDSDDFIQQRFLDNYPTFQALTLKIVYLFLKSHYHLPPILDALLSLLLYMTLLPDPNFASQHVSETSLNCQSYSLIRLSILDLSYYYHFSPKLLSAIIISPRLHIYINTIYILDFTAAPSASLIIMTPAILLSNFLQSIQLRAIYLVMYQEMIISINSGAKCCYHEITLMSLPAEDLLISR